MSSKNSNKSIKRCPNFLTTDCVEWTADDIECLGICYGDTLSSAEFKIATKVCQLAEDLEVDVANITIPSCFTTAFLTREKTVLEFLSFLLDTVCTQQTSLETLSNTAITLTTNFEVEYPDCCSDTCNVGYNLNITEHFERVLGCLCQQADRITELTTRVENLEIELNTATTGVLDRLSAIENKLTVDMPKIQTAINCIIGETGVDCDTVILI